VYISLMSDVLVYDLGSYASFSSCLHNMY